MVICAYNTMYILDKSIDNDSHTYFLIYKGVNKKLLVEDHSSYQTST